MRDRTGDPLAQPTAEELAADQMVLQGVLRRLCMETGKSVVIVDQIPAKGKEAKEDNEIGRVLPMTASGLEYFVDVMVEVSLQERDGEIVARLPGGQVEQPGLRGRLRADGQRHLQRTSSTHMKREHGDDLPMEAPKPAAVPETIEEKQPLTLVQPQMTVQELVEKAERLGFKQADVVTGARVYHNQPNIYRLDARAGRGPRPPHDRPRRARQDGAARRRRGEADRPRAGRTQPQARLDQDRSRER